MTIYNYNWLGLANGDPWPAADWTLNTVSSPTVDVQGERGRFQQGAADTSVRALVRDAGALVSLTDVEVDVTFEFGPTGAQRPVFVVARADGAWAAGEGQTGYNQGLPANGYVLRMLSNGEFVLRSMTAGTSDTLSSGTFPTGTIGNGIVTRVRFQAEGTTLRFKVWAPATQSEPAWTTETNADWSSGNAGVAASTVTNGGMGETFFDSVAVTDLATAVDTYPLTVNVTGQGTVTGNEESPHEAGTQVTLTPVPDSGWVFDGWTGDGIDGTNENDDPLTYTMPGAAATVTATFVEATPLDTPTGFTFAKVDDTRQVDGDHNPVTGATYEWEVEVNTGTSGSPNWQLFDTGTTPTPGFSLDYTNGIDWETHYRARVRAVPEP